MNNSEKRQADQVQKSLYYLDLYRKEIGGVITIRSYERFRVEYPGSPSVYHIAKAFGTWREGCKQVGLRVGAKYTHTDIFRAIESARSFLGNDMTVEEYRNWAKSTGHPSIKVFVTVFGSWSNALWAYDKQRVKEDDECTE